MTLLESSLRDTQEEHRALVVSKTVIGVVSSPVLAANYNDYNYDPALNGGGSSGYNTGLGANNS